MSSTSRRHTPNIDAIALAAIAGGKALLVEKTFTATVAGAEHIITAARAGGVFVMEAMWTRFQPAIIAARELIADGAIGEVRQVQADLGVDRPFDPTDRLFDPRQGGGAMLDLGVYVVSFAQYFLGAPEHVYVSGSVGHDRSGHRGRLAAHVRRRPGRGACSPPCATTLPGRPVFRERDGWIEVPPRFHHPNRIVLNRHRDVRGDGPASAAGRLLPMS